MSKKFKFYLFIIISSIAWAGNAFAGTDIINSTLEKVNNSIKTVSEKYEEISQKVRDITSGKILDDLGVTQAVADFNDAVDRTKYVVEKTKKLFSSDAAIEEANQADAEHYGSIRDGADKTVIRSREILEERGLRKKDDNKEAKATLADKDPIVQKENTVKGDTKNTTDGSGNTRDNKANGSLKDNGNQKGMKTSNQSSKLEDYNAGNTPSRKGFASASNDQQNKPNSSEKEESSSKRKADNSVVLNKNNENSDIQTESKKTSEPNVMQSQARRKFVTSDNVSEENGNAEKM